MKSLPLSTALARVVVLCVAPLALLAVWQAWQQLQDHEVGHRREAGDLARNVAYAFDRMLDARIKALNMLATSPLADNPGDWPLLYRQAQAFEQSFGTHVVFADPQGQMLFNTRVPFGAALPRLPQPQGRSAAPLALQTGKPQVGDSFMGPIAQEPLVAIASPVLREGRPVQLVLTTIETRMLQDRLAHYALPEGWSMALVDGARTDLARRSPSGFDSARDVDPDRRFVAPLTLSAWSVVVEVPRSVDQGHRARVMAVLAATILLALGLGLGGGVMASRRISQQVAALNRGPDNHPPSPRPALEIAELEAARGRMARAQHELEASESHQRLWLEAFRHAEIGVAISDARTNHLIDVNAAFARQLG
ncbi:MAG: cache domain-containing protein, partial [Rubrivivax sp.]|nr:cache domain-containing protein [Rubrivivax sp.]